MNILVTYAVEAEFAPWRKLRVPQRISLGGSELQRIQLEHTVVDFLITGVGAESARRAAAAVLSPQYSLCLISGFAGALTSSCRLGQVIAPQSVQQQTSRSSLRIVDNLHQQAVKSGAVDIPTMITGDQVVATAEEKSRLAAQGDAVDMESFAILELALQKGIPAAVLRVISDEHDRDLPHGLDTMIDAKGDLKIGGVVRYVATHPTKVPALMRLGRDSKAAAETLAIFLEKFIEKISSEMQMNSAPQLQQAVS
jgi:adenosylhomocysteine nucleosidase